MAAAIDIDIDFDFDFLIIGSGFGGSVSALRLAEKGYSVCVLERGRRFGPDDFAKTNWDVRRYLWLPLLKCFGIQNMSLFRNILILGGSGVGGGSLVYANTLLEPGEDFYQSKDWKNIADWRAELAPHYRTAKRMLGVATNPKLTFVDQLLKDCANDLGRGESFRPTEVGIYFGKSGQTVADPYFEGKGPERAGCTFCGGCMVGCRHNAKNTLDKNYLYLAEKNGAKIIAQTNAVGIRPLDSAGGKQGQGYEVSTEDSGAWWFKNRRVFKAKNVILSAGVIGTLNLLWRCKTVTKTLSAISDRLGHNVRTNSETLVGVTEPKRPSDHDYSDGIAISSVIHPDDYTHVEPVRYPKGSDFMRLLAAPMVDGASRLMRPLKMLWTIISSPIKTLQLVFNMNWAQSTVIFLVMQTVDNKMCFKLGRSLFTLFRRRLITEPEAGAAVVPSYIAMGNQVARAFAAKVNGIPQSTINEVFFNIPVTAHILGGCGIGASKDTGVIDVNHEVFGYKGLYVCDGSVIPANLGVNPSLTITAMTERAMSRVPRASP